MSGTRRVRRGITPVVAIVLLLMMTVAAAGGAYTFVTSATQDRMDEASASLATSTEVRSMRCADTSVTVGLSNTGDRGLQTGSVTAYLFRGGELLETAEENVSGADVLQPGGFSELAFPFTTYLEPGTRYTVEIGFENTDHAVEQPCQAQTGDLVGYWNFESGSGGTVVDLTQYGNDGTLQDFDFDADSGWDTGHVGEYALRTDGTDDTVTIPDDASFSALAGAGHGVSVSAWVSMDSPGGFAFWVDSAVGLGDISTANGNIEFWVQGQGGFEGFRYDATGIDDGAFHHVVGVYNGSTGTRMWVDGVEMNFSTPDLDVVDGSGDSYIGTFGGSDYWDGRVDDVRVYSRALTEQEALDIYEATR